MEPLCPLHPGLTVPRARNPGEEQVGVAPAQAPGSQSDLEGVVSVLDLV